MKKELIHLSFPEKELKGHIRLDGSKSISNRALIIRALTSRPAAIHHLSTSDDTRALQHILGSSGPIYDAGAAGTTFRFLTAYLAAKKISCVLTGSERMKNRPVGNLVEALRHLGADIEYMEKEGYPPLRFNPTDLDKNHVLSIETDVSSQFISALLLIAPTLPKGLTIHLKGEMVSRSYIELTLHVMESFGVSHTWVGDTITIKPQEYQSKEFTVEADWSAASYYYGIAALVPKADFTMDGLGKNTFQGDGVVAQLYEKFGISTRYTDNGIVLTKSEDVRPSAFEHDFIRCPDIAQTLAVTCGAVGTEGLFTGLQTLSIKETDRIAALQNELKKMEVSFIKMPEKFSSRTKKEYFLVSGKVSFPEEITFPTYEDHRMAMAFAPLAALHPIQIEEPEVVNKSYPQFWEDLKSVGFQMKFE